MDSGRRTNETVDDNNNNNNNINNNNSNINSPNDRETPTLSVGLHRDETFLSMLTQPSPLPGRPDTYSDSNTNLDSSLNSNSNLNLDMNLNLSSNSNSNLGQPICQLNTTCDIYFSLFPDIDSDGSGPHSQGYDEMYSMTGRNHSSSSNGNSSFFELPDHHPMIASSSSRSGNALSHNSTTIRQLEPPLSFPPEIQLQVEAFLANLANYNLVNNAEHSEEDDYENEAAMNDEEAGEWVDQEAMPGIEEEQIALGDDGLTEEQIVANMRTETYNAAAATATAATTGFECCICWDGFDDGQTIGVLDCNHGHRYHEYCIKKWLLSKNCCPLCRMDGLIIP